MRGLLRNEVLLQSPVSPQRKIIEPGMQKCGGVTEMEETGRQAGRRLPISLRRMRSQAHMPELQGLRPNALGNLGATSIRTKSQESLPSTLSLRLERHSQRLLSLPDAWPLARRCRLPEIFFACKQSRVPDYLT